MSDEDRARRPVAGRCRRGSPRWAASSPTSLAGRERARDARRARVGGDGRGHGRVARRDARRRRDPRRARTSGSSTDTAVASGPDIDAVVHEVVDRVLAGEQGCLSDPRRARTRRRSTGSSRRSRRAIPTSRSRCTKAGSRTTRSSSSLSDASRRAPIRVLLVEDNDVYRESLVFLLGAAGGLEVVGAVADGASARTRVPRARAGRRRPRLSPARHGRRGGRGRDPRATCPSAASSS